MLYKNLLLRLHCSAVPVHTILVYCSAVHGAILLHLYTMILLYPLEYFFRQLVSTLAYQSDLVDIPQYCLYDGVFPNFFVEVWPSESCRKTLWCWCVAQSIDMRGTFDFKPRALDFQLKAPTQAWVFSALQNKIHADRKSLVP